MQSIFENSTLWKTTWFFLANPKKKLHVKALARRIGIGAGSASTCCKDLADAGLLMQERQGNMLLYWLNRKSATVQQLQRLWLAEWLKKVRFTEAFAEEEPNIVSLAVYGSYVKGDFDENSDLDVLVIANTQKDFNVVAANLGKGLGAEVMPTKFTLAQWKVLAEKRDPFYLEALENHVLLYGSGLVV